MATNRYASYRYDLLDKLECGVVLQGTEVKSLRAGSATLKDGYANIRDGELWLHNVHIPPYGPASRENHEPERPRKLLAHRREIERLIGRINERGLTLVPTRSTSPAAGEGRDRPRPRQGPLRQARVDQGARTSGATSSASCATPGAERPGYTSLRVRATCVASMPSTSSAIRPR